MAFKLTSAFIAFACAVATVSAQTSGTFNVMSMNVAGLPAILNGNNVGDKTTNTMIMGQNFNKYKYDLIHVQEDFNYHATLYQYDAHPFRTATSGGVPFGSGLNTISKYDWVEYERTKWNKCSQASESDCLTPKGFTFMRWNVAPGVQFDVVNLHADAGTEAEDNIARASNLQQVADYLTANSKGNAIIVFGDTNSRYTRASDIVPAFVKQNALIDAWVTVVRKSSPPAAGTDAITCGPNEVPPEDNTCETVDKIIFRGNKAVTLTATSFIYDTSRFLSANGTNLSDHHPARVEFSWSLSSSFRQSDMWGGPHGTWFNDFDTLPSNPVVSSITLRGAERVDAAAFRLSSGLTLSHGGTGGTTATLTLASGEYIVSAYQCSAQNGGRTTNFYLRLTTSTAKTVATGVTTSSCVTYTAPTGFAIVGMRGRTGDEMAQLGWIYAKRA